jgi:hypothetical protein
MEQRALIFSVVLLAVAAGVVESRDLSVTVVGGTVEAKDTFTSDPYMSVTVCNVKKTTPTIRSTTTPTWNWTNRVT